LAYNNKTTNTTKEETMTEPDDTAPALAWNMRRPARTSPGGRKMKSTYFCLMLVDNYLLTGSGRRGSMKYKVQKFSAPSIARSVAVALTEGKERRDYVLHGPMKTMLTAAGQREWLETQLGNDDGTADEALDKSFRDIFNRGTDLVP
jgi:hypothetical protein